MRLRKGDTITADMLNEFFLDLYTKANQMVPDQIDILTTGQFMNLSGINSNEILNRYTDQMIISDEADTLLCELAQDIKDLNLS